MRSKTSRNERIRSNVGLSTRASSSDEATRGPKPVITERGAPFTSLLAVSSLVIAVLLVAGFSYRWTYYYNFGLKDLALQLPVQSVAISAMELIRTPRDALFSFCVVVIPLLVLNFLLSLIQTVSSFAKTKGWRAANLILRGRGLDLENRLVTDALRAVVLIYSAYWAGSQSGWQAFRAHVTETSSNTLSTVTAVMLTNSQGGALPFACKPAEWDRRDSNSEAVPPVIGDPRAIEALRDGRACNIEKNQSWRMLYRDDKFVYLFATGSEVARPLTVVLPNTDRVIIVLGVVASETPP